MTSSPAGPLAGLTVGRVPGHLPAEVAVWLLSGLGASVLDAVPASGPFRPARARTTSASVCREADLVISDDAGAFQSPAAVLRPSAIICPEAGVPAGTIDYTCGVALAVAALVAWRSGITTEVTELGVAIQTYLPQVMAASYGSPTWGAPPPPVSAPGGGWLSADLGGGDDRQTFSSLLSILPPDADASSIAAAAQEWRLPVCEYVPRPPRSPAPEAPILCRPAPTVDDDSLSDKHQLYVPPLSDIEVCDLTTMWAGPFATWLLNRLGARIHKVEPAVRLDGTRAIDGGGIYPGGRQRRPGEDSGLWNALNHGKVRVPLDLRDRYQREQFVALAASCDVVIDGFSPRVMPNFGLAGRLASGPGRPLLASMPAFPEGPRRDWVAYGTSIHALLGLGEQEDGSYAAPSVSYPDPVAGFTGALAVIAALVGLERGRPLSALEVSLWSACQPLQALGRRGANHGPDGHPGEILFDAGMADGAFVPRAVAGMQLMHPRSPLRPAGAG
jgi:crotonobetainyl-CoA:carnitine CoA-transferase CaiB-like acyl-CoA transferase